MFLQTMSRLEQLLNNAEQDIETRVFRFNSVNGIAGLGDQPFVSVCTHISHILCHILCAALMVEGVVQDHVKESSVCDKKFEIFCDTR